MDRRLRGGPQFDSQLHSGSQPFVTPVPEGLKSSSDVSGHQEHTWHTFMYGGKTPVYIKENNNFKRIVN